MKQQCLMNLYSNLFWVKFKNWFEGVNWTNIAVFQWVGILKRKQFPKSKLTRHLIKIGKQAITLSVVHAKIKTDFNMFLSRLQCAQLVELHIAQKKVLKTFKINDLM